MKSNILDDLEINKENNSFKERIDFINNFIENNNKEDDNFNLQKYFNKFSGRYNAKVTIEGNRPSNYKLNAKLNGYLDVFRDDNKIKKETFSIDLEGGLLTGKGFLRIKKLPLSASYIFLIDQEIFLEVLIWIYFITLIINLSLVKFLLTIHQLKITKYYLKEVLLNLITLFLILTSLCL